MLLIGIAFPVGAFVMSTFLRPTRDPNNPNRLRSILIPGYETDHSLYTRRLSTYECGSEPMGDARIDFHFQYYWYAIVFLVFDIGFMFLAFGGVIAIGARETVTTEVAVAGVLSMGAMFALMTLGIWHVFRKRGKIYI
jgi:NADH:ubiquinone oxidoreductase subunit 3 (subunit A)